MPLKTFLLAAALIALARCASRDEGEKLALRNCATCHAFPAPALLDKTTWRNDVLPEMAFRMGLDMSKLPGTDPDELSQVLHAIPSSPLVSEEEWKSIQEYYVRSAPDSLAKIVRHPPSPLQQFTTSTVVLPVSGHKHLTMVECDTNRNRILVGTREGKLFVLNKSLQPLDSFRLPGPPSDVFFLADGTTLVSCMGVMDPNDQSKGSIIRIGASLNDPQVVIDSIKRPVNAVAADLNSDGMPDVLVSAFGNFTGDLSAYEKFSAGYRRHLIHSFPGTRKSVVRDFTGDGLPDIMALITQGDERIALFTNRGGFKFSYQVLLRFPPVYGSSYFELVDFNNDGALDILYTNGDNADYSSVLKPYHGIRIFLNDGTNHFREDRFYPMYGASVARACDFDGDGDLDIAAISFFPDFKNHPDESFVYLRNDGNTFTPFKTPLAATSRWIAIEVLDIDDDGDQDLALAALAFPTSVPEDLFQRWGNSGTSLLILRNNLKD